MMDFPIEEYFRYHPPLTPERVAKHDAVNQKTLEVCKDLILSSSKSLQEIFNDLESLIEDSCSDPVCKSWAHQQLQPFETLMHNTYSQADPMAVIMHCQQIRMFLNQGITIDEMKVKKLNP